VGWQSAKSCSGKLAGRPLKNHAHRCGRNAPISRLRWQPVPTANCFNGRGQPTRKMHCRAEVTDQVFAFLPRCAMSDDDDTKGCVQKIEFFRWDPGTWSCGGRSPDYRRKRKYAAKTAKELTGTAPDAALEGICANGRPLHVSLGLADGEQFRPPHRYREALMSSSLIPASSTTPTHLPSNWRRFWCSSLVRASSPWIPQSNREHRDTSVVGSEVAAKPIAA